MKERAFGFLLTVTALLYAAQIDAAPLWYDEAGSAFMASLPLGRLVAATAGDTHPPLYLLILAAVERVAGVSTFWLRLPSYVCAVGVVWLLWSIGRELKLSDDAVTLSLVLITASAFQLHFAQEARMYTLLQVLVLGAFLSALQLRLLRFTLLSALALWTHNYGLIYLAVNGGVLLYVLWKAHRRNPLSSALFQTSLCVLAALVCWSPWAFTLAGQMRNVAGGYWIQPISDGGVVDVLYHFFFAFTLADWLQPTSVIVMVGVMAWATAKALRLRQENALLLVWMVYAPLAFVIVASLVWRPILLFRGFAPSVPLLFGLLGWAIAEGTRLPQRVYALAALLPLMIAAVVGHYLWNVENKTASQTATAIIREQWQPGDLVVHANEGSYVETWPQLRGLPAYVLPRCARTTIGGMSLATQAALGIEELPDGLTWKRAWYFVGFAPTITQCNADRAQSFIEDHSAVLVAAIRNNEFIEANVWMLKGMP